MKVFKATDSDRMQTFKWNVLYLLGRIGIKL